MLIHAEGQHGGFGFQQDQITRGKARHDVDSQPIKVDIKRQLDAANARGAIRKGRRVCPHLKVSLALIMSFHFLVTRFMRAGWR
jgi:hypothetical protein